MLGLAMSFDLNGNLSYILIVSRHRQWCGPKTCPLKSDVVESPKQTCMSHGKSDVGLKDKESEASC